MYNRYINKKRLPFLKYMSRLEKRMALCGKKYVMAFDFKAWFDQIELLPEVQGYHVLRLKNPIEWEGELHSLFVLTKDPMGATHAAHTAQTITWALLEPVYDMMVELVTMIDNVIIASNNEDDFVKAVQTFVARCEKYGAMLNDADDIPRTRDAILQAGRNTATSWTALLGEEYKDDTVRNTVKCTSHLQAAWERLQQSTIDPNITITRRQIAAIASLAFYMAGTLQVGIAQHFHVMRLHSKMASTPGKWDDKYDISRDELNHLGNMVGPLLVNKEVKPWAPPLPSNEFSDYEAVIILDACGSGWGGWVWFQNTMFELKAGFSRFMGFSAQSEPIAATEIINWLRNEMGCRGRIAVITDHIAMVTAQRRPISGNGGFSLAYHLNNFFIALYGSDGSLQGDVFHVDGHANPTDPLSRSTIVGQRRSVIVVSDVNIPPLTAFMHPYREHPRSLRKWWCV